MTKVYLAGPMGGLSWVQAAAWRHAADTALREHGITAFSPLRHKSFLKEVDKIHVTENAYNTDNPWASDRALTARDRNDCTTADAVLMNLKHTDHVSVGTMIELGWADECRIPIIVIMEPGNVHDHPMVRAMATTIVPDLQGGIRATLQLLTPGDA